MDITQSRLSSITEQSNQVQESVKTQEALLKVYYNLFAINLVKWQDDPKHVFSSKSQQVEQKIPSMKNSLVKYKQQQVLEKQKQMKKYIKQSQKQQPAPKPTLLSNEQLRQKLSFKTQQSPTKHTESPQKNEQFVQTIMAHKTQKQLDQTAQSKVLISNLLQRLSQFDEERTQIKFQIYSEDVYRHESLYKKWAQIHKRMKEVLEIFVNKVGNGKTLLEIYNQLDKLKNSNKMIQGYSEKELLSKLDIYLQSLFLDQREILLFRSANQKSRSIISGSSGQRNLRKKLNYG